ncbi:MAG: deoxyribodipyrimidine photo-lyase [Verrucomicrobiaceae bacterium]
MSQSPTVLWFRHDLRLSDHEALSAAVARGGPVIPVFIWSPDEEGGWSAGGASRWWLHQSLERLGDQLIKLGARLVIRRGLCLEELMSIVRETGADAVYWSRRYEPAVIERDRHIKEQFTAQGLQAKSFNSALLHEPWMIQNKSGKPFQVFTPFWKNCLILDAPAEPLPAPERLLSYPKPLKSLSLSALELEPKINWIGGMNTAWEPGEIGAEALLQRFCEAAFSTYSIGRNRPDQSGTSRLSPHLHFGEISSRQVWHALRRHAEKNGLSESEWRGSQFLAEIGWREFAHHLLFHFPHTPTHPLRAEFERFPWREDAELLKAWQRGRTGYPLVDAGMRELWTTGWMHNRVRMVVASFLVKDLLLPWQTGAEWFWDTLVDADLASNTLGWQWTAGCGADAAPFFRIFNPVSQGEKFDPHGDYVRRWVPELALLSAKWIHHPWMAPPDILQSAGVVIGHTYPSPIVDHGHARQKALNAFTSIKRGG